VLYHEKRSHRLALTYPASALTDVLGHLCIALPSSQPMTLPSVDAGVPGNDMDLAALAQ